MNRRGKPDHLRHPLPILAGLLLVSSLAFFPLSRGSVLADLPEVALPLGVSLGIVLYSVHLLQADYSVDRVRRIATYGWACAIVASIGIWVLTHQVQGQLSVTLLLEEGLTIVSVASGLGIVLGAHVLHEHRSERQIDYHSDRTRVLAETVWTDNSAKNPILQAVTLELAALEGVDPLELEPLYEYVDPTIFAELRDHDGSQWQFLFYTDDYEIRVSGQGTVTIYDADPSRNEVDGVRFQRKE